MEDRKNTVNSEIFFLAMMTAIASGLYFLEMLLPRPLPFLKPGLSNIIVLLLIFSSFIKEAIIVATAKSVIGAFATGMLFSPTFLLSFSGSLCSAVIMVVALKSLHNITVFGISVVGSFTHLFVQLLLVRFFIIKSGSIISLYPIIAIFSVIAGLFTGIIAFYFMKHINLRSIYAKINA